MKKIILDEGAYRENLFPFTLTREIADIRVGIFTLREKWEKLFQYRILDSNDDVSSAMTVPANIIPNKHLVDFLQTEPKSLSKIPDDIPVSKIEFPWQIFELNDQEIRNDFHLISVGRISAAISSTNKTTAPENIFLEPGAKVEHAILNASTGPIYIGKNAEVMEGAMIRGPFAMCEGAVVKMGARIYGASTIGPYSVVGGEVKNSVIFSHSNKAHDGYLGDAVIGSWCNLGAGTTNSNLKNNASPVKIWNPHMNKFLVAGLKCGLLMGDYSRAAINTAFNTGSVVGASCNIFCTGLTPTYIGSFTWGISERYELEKALKHISDWKKIKNELITEAEMRTLKHIFEQS